MNAAPAFEVTASPTVGTPASSASGQSPVCAPLRIATLRVL